MRGARPQQQLTHAGAAFAHSGYVDCGLVLHRAFCFADAAADAEVGDDEGFVEHYHLAENVLGLFVVGLNRFGRHRADLFADHAGDLVGPGEAAAGVDEGGAQAHRPLFTVAPLPQLLGDADTADGAGGADFGAEVALELAVGDAEIHHRRPQRFYPTLPQHGRLQHVGGADVDALIALDAALEKLVLLYRAWRPDHAGGEVFVVDQPVVAQRRSGDQAERAAEDQLAPGHIRKGNHLFFVLAQHCELEGVFGAVVNAVHAAEAFGLAHQRLGVGRAFAALQAEVAVGALVDHAVDAPQAIAGDDAEQRAQRTEETAEEARLPQIHQHEKEEDNADPEGADEYSVLDARGELERVEQCAVGAESFGGGLQLTGCAVEQRREEGGHGPVHHDDGIEQPDLQRTHRCHQQEDDEYGVLEVLGRRVAVLFDASRRLFGVEQPGDELVQAAVGADPVAEDPPEQQGDDDDDQPHPSSL